MSTTLIFCYIFFWDCFYTTLLTIWMKSRNWDEHRDYSFSPVYTLAVCVYVCERYTHSIYGDYFLTKIPSKSEKFLKSFPIIIRMERCSARIHLKQEFICTKDAWILFFNAFLLNRTSISNTFSLRLLENTHTNTVSYKMHVGDFGVANDIYGLKETLKVFC